MHIVQPYRPLQVGFNSRVLEQNRRFFFTVSASLGIHLQIGEALLDVDFLKDAFESMGDNPFPELGMPKPCGEFLVTGAYFAPGGEAVGGGEVRVRLGKKEKSLYVFGPRKWGAGGISTRPDPVTRVPVDYFHAFGGETFDKNPDGMGCQDERLPCIEDPAKLVTSPGDRPDPAGFAPLPLDCPQRMRFRGTYDDDYKKKYYPGHPADFDWRFFLNTPQDQWINGFFQGDEIFEIFNMHPDLPLVKGRLPDLYARAFIRHTINSDTPEFGELPLNLDTVWFFPEKLLCLLVFRGVTEVADDEAEQVSEVLLAYEDRRDPPRTLAHYREALEKRRTGENPFLNYFQTRDLIPPGAKSALTLFQEKGSVEPGDSALSGNIQARTDASRKMIDDKIEEAAGQAEETMTGMAVPVDVAASTGDKDGFDLRKITREKAKSQSDPDVDEFTRKLEAIMPGITSGDAGAVDLEDFPFDRIEEITGTAEEMGKKKAQESRDRLRKEIDGVREKIREQMSPLRETGDDMPADMQDTLVALQEQMEVLEALEKGETPRVPLPRLKAAELMAEIPRQPPPEVLAAMEHLQGLKTMGVAGESVDDLEARVTAQLEAAASDLEENLCRMEGQFKTGYMMGAHFMEEGLSPHRESMEEVQLRFLAAVAGKGPVAGGDWACIDLAGKNLDHIDLSGAFLEQVNFSGASLRGANLSGAILARANLCDADFSGANLQGANIGAVSAVKTVFAGACLRAARLSRGNFSGADFAEADLEEAEMMNVCIDDADFSRAKMPGLQFLEIGIRGAAFAGADLSTSFFMMGSIEDADFSGAAMNRCLFANTQLKNVRFDGADMGGSCFAGTDAEQTRLEGITFRGANLQKSNFQRMVMPGADLTGADLENAYFESAGLPGADLSRAAAGNAQFRSANLTGARLDDINLMSGSLAKARLVRASLKRANLFQVDFLRATITDTDFEGANLDSTLIEYWRPR